MAELRWNPLLGTWTMVAPGRQARPNLDPNYCPFCPSSGRVPDHYTVHLYPNDFPALSTPPGAYDSQTASPELGPHSPYRVAPAAGACDVILYSPDHHASLWQLPLSQIEELIAMWTARTVHHAQNPAVRFVFPFENRGEAVGVTMHHPHGQLYAYPFVPLKLETELRQCRHYLAQHGESLWEAIHRAELADGRRLLHQTDHFLTYIPHFTDYPFGAFISARRAGCASLTDLSPAEIAALAQHLKALTTAFDALYQRPFPYMLCLHQAPVNSPEWADAPAHYRLHIQFYPPLRSPDRIKYYASSEMGAWAAANTRAVEDSAAELRAVWPGGL